MYKWTVISAQTYTNFAEQMHRVLCYIFLHHILCIGLLKCSKIMLFLQILWCFHWFCGQQAQKSTWNPSANNIIQELLGGQNICRGVIVQWIRHFSVFLSQNFLSLTMFDIPEKHWFPCFSVFCNIGKSHPCICKAGMEIRHCQLGHGKLKMSWVSWDPCEPF